MLSPIWLGLFETFYYICSVRAWDEIFELIRMRAVFRHVVSEMLQCYREPSRCRLSKERHADGLMDIIPVGSILVQ